MQLVGLVLQLSRPPLLLLYLRTETVLLADVDDELFEGQFEIEDQAGESL